MLELQDIGSRQPSMESLTGAPDGSHLHPGHQYSNQRSPSLRFVSYCLGLSNLNSEEVPWFFMRYQTNRLKHKYIPCRRSGSPLVRTPSPRRRNHLHPHHDVGFSDTVSNVVEIVKEERGHHRSYRPNGRYPRGMRFTYTYLLHIFCLWIFQTHFFQNTLDLTLFPLLFSFSLLSDSNFVSNYCFYFFKRTNDSMTVFFFVSSFVWSRVRVFRIRLKKKRMWFSILNV